MIYLTGRLENSAARMTVDTSMGTPTGLSIARTGTPLLLLDDSLQLLEMCQRILPPVPVQPPRTSFIVPDQTWFPLATYSACGSIQMEDVIGAGFKTMTIAHNTR